MLPNSLLESRYVAPPGAAKHYITAANLAAMHVAAFAIMVWSEHDLLSKTAFVLSWGFLNFAWLSLLRRPAFSAALSLMMFVVLILLSRFKHEAFSTTADFVDLMIIDSDTFSFLMTAFLTAFLRR